mgnify:CR=1 FL=1
MGAESPRRALARPAGGCLGAVRGLFRGGLGWLGDGWGQLRALLAGRMGSGTAHPASGLWAVSGEIRRTKFEIRNKSEARMIKTGGPGHVRWRP